MFSRFHDLSGVPQGELTTYFLLGGATVLSLYAFLGYLRWRDRKKHKQKKESATRKRGPSKRSR
ncbi:MAG: hypothetical protein Q8M35_03610, partial [Pseudohongiella sp.]|nr:hypothetical protein [Pseudohongiella sp.]